MIDICCIGHVTHDHIVTPQSDVHMPGGTSYYFSHGIARLLDGKTKYQLVTSLAEEDMQAVRDMQALGVDAKVIPSRHTVYFENIYGENLDNRKQRVLAVADPFTVENLKNIEARYIVLGSLLADDFSLDVLKYLSQKGILVVDAQGYLREVRGEKVYAVDWTEKREALKYVDVLKVNEHEVQVLTGEQDLRKGAERLAEWGVREVLLTLGSQGSIILAGGKFYDIPSYRPLQEVDATGCGDTYVMGFIFQRSRGADIVEAGKFAAGVSSIKLEHSGPFCGTTDEVMSLIANSSK